MTKFKKLLLTLAPISAIAIATPIVLTSCSANATTPEIPSNPDNPTNPDGGNGDTGENGKLTPDSTNKTDFVPTTSSGLFANVEKLVKAGKKGEEDKQVDTAFAAYKDLKKEDVLDSINMWSFNKWFDASKIEGVSYVSNLTKSDVVRNDPSKEGEKAIWDIVFSYKFQITITNKDKSVDNVLAEKSYSLSNATLTDKVPFNTETKLFDVNGKSMLENKPSTFFDAKVDETTLSEPVKKVKAFLDEKNSTFDSKAVYKSFIKNKGIEGGSQTTTQTDGDWSESIDKPDGVVLSEDKKTITVDLSKIDITKKWYDLSKDSTKENVQKAVYIESTDGKKTKNLTETFKKLIVGQDKFKSIEVIEKLDDSKKTINFTIKLIGNDSKESALNINFSNYKEDAPQTLAEPIWNESEIKKDTNLSIDSSNKNIVNLNLTTNPIVEWGSCKSDTPYTAVKSTFEIDRYQNKIKALIDGKDYQIDKLTCGPEIKGTNSSDMDVRITFTKKADKTGIDAKPSLIFKVKNFKKTQ